MKEKIIKILEEHTEWSENGQADLIWQSEYNHIAACIVELFAIPIVRVFCPECGEPYITYTEHEHYQCNSCDHEWI